ncbi:MAG: hypothetical protein V4735_02260 [Pseudomonadota bacterium]
MSEYFVEFHRQGRFVKVTAVDPVTGTEAVIVGDAAQGQAMLARSAVQKLEFLLKRLPS